jgi:nucleobase transporter 1/2
MTYEEKTEEWQIRMREVQGAICVSAIFQVVMGFSGKHYLLETTKIMEL